MRLLRLRLLICAVETFEIETFEIVEIETVEIGPQREGAEIVCHLCHLSPPSVSLPPTHYKWVSARAGGPLHVEWLNAICRWAVACRGAGCYVQC